MLLIKSLSSNAEHVLIFPVKQSASGKLYFVSLRCWMCFAGVQEKHFSARMPDFHRLLAQTDAQVLKIEFSSVFKRIFTFQFGSSAITPSKTARNLGVVIDDKLNFTDHITKTARSCRFTLYKIKKIRPFLWEHATQLLVQALVLSRLDYCNALLAGLPASSIKPLQLIQNAAARLIFNEPKRTHVTR